MLVIYVQGPVCRHPAVGEGVGTESTMEPSEEKVDGTGETGGTRVGEEAERDWEGEEQEWKVAYAE